MDQRIEQLSREANFTRYQPGQQAGHYESFFQRANHPTEPLAFWIRYTIFSPAGAPEKAIGELWAIWFDGRNGRHVAVKREVPFSECAFAGNRFFARVNDASLQPGRLVGSADAGADSIEWELSFEGGQPPLFDLPPNLYETSLPKAKALVGIPLARYHGTLRVNGEPISIDGWPGSQNHNWGSKHTDHYAWGQVAGFDEAPESFLEVATARIRLGPVWTPFMTPLVLRHEGREYAMRSLLRSMRRGRFDYFTWTFDTENAEARVQGRIEGRREDFVGLRYYNPPGGTKTCLNSKIASCEVILTPKDGSPPVKLTSRHRAAFEILTDDGSHGVTVRV